MLVRSLTIFLVFACVVLAWGTHKERSPAPPMSGLRSHRGKLDAEDVISKRQVKADSIRNGHKRQGVCAPAPSGVCSCPGTTFCNGICSDYTTDNANCGGCYQPCSDLTYCSGGTCVCTTTCPGSMECVDTTSDPNNCGSCGTSCGTTGICALSSCLTCPILTPTACDNVCTDTLIDNGNCGTCGSYCLPGQMCQGGSCVSCPPGSTSPFCSSTLYNLLDAFVGPQFFDGFVWEAIGDPTDGTVNYVDQQTAITLNLSWASADTFIMRIDDTTVLPAAGNINRNSVRIKTANTYTTGVYILDLRHMPTGCAVWPSWWTTEEAGWPLYGEIDIIEFINGNPPNVMTLHTQYAPPDCSMPILAPGQELGTQPSNDQDCQGSNGCSVVSGFPDSAGDPFNTQANLAGEPGGVYAMERTADAISIWFWPRSTAVPPFIPGGPTVDTSSFGTPDAYFPSTASCTPFSEFFGEHNVIFDMTLCGSYAGNVYGNYPQCPNSGSGWIGCNELVWSTPSAFSDAYWDIAGMWIYT